MEKILLSILAVNFASFVVMRIWWRLTGRLSAEIIVPRRKFRVEGENEIVFLSAGNLAQPREAFKFLRSRLKRKQFAFLKFKMIGWSALETAKHVAQMVGPNDQVTVYAISVGDHVARYLESSPIREQLQTYTINPCPNRKALRPGLRILLVIAAPIFWIICHLLGWISVIPFIPATGGRYSLILLADQYMIIVFDTPPLYTVRTKGVVLSSADELLDNSYLRMNAFAGVKSVWIPTHHGDTVGMEYEYLQGVVKLLKLQES